MTHDSTTTGRIRRERLAFENHYTTIPNAWLRDTRLSRRARGLLAELLSHTAGWEISVRGLIDGGPEGRDAVEGAVKELERVGYLRRERVRRQDGTLGAADWVLQAPPAPAPMAGKPGTGKPGPGEQHTQNPISETKSSPLRAPQGAEPALDGLEAPPEPVEDHFSVFWAAYPRKVGKPQAERAWKKAVKGGTHWSISVGGALAYAEDPNRDAAFTAHPSTWLNREGWNDDALPERPPVPGAPVLQPALPSGTMSERVEDCTARGRAHRPIGDGTCMLCETRLAG